MKAPQLEPKGIEFPARIRNEAMDIVYCAEELFEDMLNGEVPHWLGKCACGANVERWHGESEVDCSKCGREYNSSGQELRSDWRGNPSNWDEDVSDLEGYEIQHAL